MGSGVGSGLMKSDMGEMWARHRASTRMLWSQKSCSTIARSDSARPAWWMPTPKARVCRSAWSLTRSRRGARAWGGMRRNCASRSSAEQYAMRSRAVRRVCLGRVRVSDEVDGRSGASACAG